MRAIYHYACSDKLAARIEALAPSWLTIEPCAELDEARLASLLGDTDVLLHRVA